MVVLRAMFFGIMSSVVAAIALAAVPANINYQGYLADQTGVAVDAATSITFSIYNVETGGMPLWSDTLIVPVDNGLFSVTLGSPVNPFPADLFATPLYIGIEVAGDGEMTPRRPLATAAFSFRAAEADTLQGSTAADLDQSAAVATLQANTVLQLDTVLTIGGGGEARLIAPGGLEAANSAGGPDLIVGGLDETNAGDDGIISSAPGLANSDLILKTNDALVVELDDDASGNDADFLIVDANDVEIFNVEEDGQVRLHGPASMTAGDDPTFGPVLTFLPEAPDQTESGRIRFRESSSPTSLRGGYLHYDGSADALHIGIHDTFDNNPGNDEDIITIDSTSGHVTISDTLTVAGELQNAGLAALQANTVLQLDTLLTVGGGGEAQIVAPGGLEAANSAAGPDLIVGGLSGTGEGDDGVIASEPSLPGSDLLLQTNDALGIQLDADGNGEDADFFITDKDNIEIFNLEEDGQLRLHGATSMRAGDDPTFGPVLSFLGESTDQVESGRLRFRESSTPTNLRGGYIHYDGSANEMHIGVHDTSDNDLANDENIITIDRASGQVSVSEDLIVQGDIRKNYGGATLGWGTPLAMGIVSASGNTFESKTANLISVQVVDLGFGNIINRIETNETCTGNGSYANALIFVTPLTTGVDDVTGGIDCVGGNLRAFVRLRNAFGHDQVAYQFVIFRIS